MYKYVKGITVLSEERMPSALEVAQEYNLWIPLNDSMAPNGELVEFLVKAYIERNNYKASEYYYINPHNVSFPVYPRKFIEPIMNEFIEYLKQENITKDKEKIYTIENIDFIYYEEPRQECKITSLEEFKKRKKGKHHD
jgi:hypothetical protein